MAQNPKPYLRHAHVNTDIFVFEYASMRQYEPDLESFLTLHQTELIESDIREYCEIGIRDRVL